MVFYYGDDWDGACSLYDMFGFDQNTPPELKQLVSDYHINLFNPNDAGKLPMYNSDLQTVFGMLQCKKDKNAMRLYLEKHRSYFEHMTNEALCAAGVLLNSNKLLLKYSNDKKGDELNMCKAFEDMYNDGIEEGIAQGMQQGIHKLVITLKELSIDAPTIVKQLVAKYGLNEEEAKMYVNEGI